MPNITDPPPQAVQADIEAIQNALDASIPSRQQNPNLLLGTWNIRAFGDLTKKWKSGSNDSPKRDFHAVRLIAEVLQRFDVIAVQEVRDNIRALRYTLKILGPEWGFLMTDVSLGNLGNTERLAFLFDRTRVKPSGLAAELVVPEILREGAAEVPANAFQHQFARTPYAVSFAFGQTTIILVTLHVHYVDKDAESRKKRIPELKAIAKWMANWARRSKSFGHNLIALGDFNIDRTDDELYQAFTSTGLHTPPALDNVPRTIWSSPNEPQKEKHYDQIAWFESGAGVPHLNMKFIRGGHFDFVGLVLKHLSKNSLSYRMSDHFPLWVELEPI